MNKVNSTKKLFSIIILFSFCSTRLVAQKDSTHKNNISINIASGLISGEVGLFYDHKLSDKYAIELSYGHRFYSFNMVENGGTGGSYLILTQRGDVIRFGLKSFYKSKNGSGNYYLIYHLSYWNLHTPIYTTRDGSNGLSRTTRIIVSVDKNVANAAFGIGKELNFNSSLFIDLFMSGGISAGQKNTHEYSANHGGYNGGPEIYPPNTFIKSLALFPTIEFGLKIGFGW